MTRLLSAYRYGSTYLALLRHFAVSRGWRFAAMLMAVVASALLHPLPFLLLAELLRSAQAGGNAITFGWHALSVRLPPDLGVLMVFLVGSLSFVLSYAVSRLVNRETLAWQSAVFWRLLNELSHISRWDRTLDLGIMLRPNPVATRIDSAVRGAFPIGRLVETGSRDAIMVMVLASILIWQDPRDMAVLVFISVLFVPAYTLALTRLVRMQAKSNAGLARLRQPVIGLLTSDVTRRPGQAVDSAAVPEATSEAISHAFGSQSHLLNEQNAMTVVAGVHLFAAFYGVYLSEGRSIMALPVEKLTFFVLLILMLRSLLGLVGLMSRLSRSYERLGLMRSVLYPSRKPPVESGSLAATGFRLVLPASQPDLAVNPQVLAGQTLVLLAPDINFGFQLLPLANALYPQFPLGPAASLTRHIPLLREQELPALLAGGTVAGPASQMRLPSIGTVALEPDPVDLAAAPVVAVTRAAFEQLQNDNAVAHANAGRVLVLALSGWTLPSWLPANTVIAISNGTALVAAGTPADVAGTLAVLGAGQRTAAPAEPAREEDVETEDAAA